MKLFSKIFLALFFFLFTSVGIQSFRDFSYKTPNPKTNLYALDGVSELKFTFQGTKPVFADENAWGVVRQSATWANGNSNFIDTLLTNLNRVGIFQLPSGTVIAQTNVDFGLGYLTKFRISMGVNQSVNASAFVSGPKTFRHKMIVWRQTDNVKLFEFFFNNYGETTGSGALLNYNLNRLNPSQFTGNAQVESYVFGVPGSRRQTYSWANGPIAIGGADDRARVVLEEMTGQSVLCVKVVIRINSNPTFNFCNSTLPQYHSTAYGQFTVSPFQTTAKFGFGTSATVDNDTTGVVCNSSSPGTTFANPLNYGIFDANGFIRDGVTMATIPSGFRPGYNVDVVYATLRSTTGGDGDRTDRATIDGLTTTVGFKDTDAAP